MMEIQLLFNSLNLGGKGVKSSERVMDKQVSSYPWR